jgi:hypothetical protein
MKSRLHWSATTFSRGAGSRTTSWLDQITAAPSSCLMNRSASTKTVNASGSAGSEIPIRLTCTSQSATPSVPSRRHTAHWTQFRCDSDSADHDAGVLYLCGAGPTAPLGSHCQVERCTAHVMSGLRSRLEATECQPLKGSSLQMTFIVNDQLRANASSVAVRASRFLSHVCSCAFLSFQCRVASTSPPLISNASSHHPARARVVTSLSPVRSTILHPAGFSNSQCSARGT